MVRIEEYTTGFVGGGASSSDKKIGVVGLTMFDLRRRGKVGKLSMVGTSVVKYPAIREHLTKNITEVYNDLDTSFESYPASDTTDPNAYKAAIDALAPGSAITIFTPDTTHYPITLYAIERKIHVLITKPAVKTLAHHQALLTAAERHGVFVYVEHHKRYDPAYADARYQAAHLGDFNYFYSYMSQPKSVNSDISYYLNSHHIDICDSMFSYKGCSPVKVSASAGKGIAIELGCDPCTEDTTTVMVTWQHRDDPSKLATRVNVADDSSALGLMWFNPFYMKYAPDEGGNFAGQGGYRYVSFEKFIDGCKLSNELGKEGLNRLNKRGLPTLSNTLATTAILEAGRRALDEGRG
ncbi:hypothetical protein BJ878DRAFT_536729 [Calycina marina]|uniref:Gfo/Idh/MocA-like oxidoreductase N-terminal domain-containing protein n=1 Tax=Calycina marina TaxID=1763456 RepID=A0A9P8CDA8_9HELO|nr:hypothetical protein BJ878DRAFT_536729 [Calycina marina]